jgi:hypothetical protein
MTLYLHVGYHDRLRLNGFDLGWCLGEPNFFEGKNESCLALETTKFLEVSMRCTERQYVSII